MNWFNYYGAIFIVIMMIPNIIFCIKCKEELINHWDNKAVEIMEQIGRFSCFGLMIINIPGTYYGLWFDNALLVYIIIDSLLLTVYSIIWIIYFKKNSIFKALFLSIIPSIIFLFSGIMFSSILLIIAAVIFASAHITISYKNAKLCIGKGV